MLSGHSLWFGECLMLPFGRAQCRKLSEALHGDFTAEYQLQRANQVTTELGGSPKADGAAGIACRLSPDSLLPFGFFWRMFV